MGEFALIIFSICLQSAIGIIVFVAIAKFLNKEAIYKKAVLTAAGLAIVGLLASFFHLGNPLSAAGSLLGFATSWLSREIWLSSIFTVLAVVAILLIYFKPSVKGGINALIIAAAIVGLIDVFAMTSVYTFASVPAWQHGSIIIEFYSAAITMGAVLFLALTREKAENMRKIVVVITGFAILFQVVAMIIYYIGLGANVSLAVQQSNSILYSMSLAVIIKWTFILVGTGILLFSENNKQKLETIVGEAALEAAATKADRIKDGGFFLAAALLVIGQIVGRYLFYAVMIVTSVGLD